MSEQNTSEKENEWAKREIGALWVKESPSQKYMSGHFTDQDGNRVRVVIFTNKHKKKDTHPDYRVYKSADPSGVGQTKEVGATEVGATEVEAAEVQTTEAAATAVEEELI